VMVWAWFCMNGGVGINAAELLRRVKLQPGELAYEYRVY